MIRKSKNCRPYKREKTVVGSYYASHYFPNLCCTGAVGRGGGGGGGGAGGQESGGEAAVGVGARAGRVGRAAGGGGRRHGGPGNTDIIALKSYFHCCYYYF